jgi:hypothetical protein
MLLGTRPALHYSLCTVGPGQNNCGHININPYTLKTEYHITVRDDAVPVCLYNPRKVPHPMLPQIKAEIESLLRQENVISL